MLNPTATIVGVVVMSVAAQAHAQTARSTEAEQVRGRQQVFLMEGVLERAVQVGIDTLRRTLSAVMPGDMLLVAGGGPQVRGFRLEGYGVFFDVEVPAVRPSLAWSLRTMSETAGVFARDLAQLRSELERAVPDPRVRAELNLVLTRIQQQVAPRATPASPDHVEVAASRGTGGGDERPAGAVSRAGVRPDLSPGANATLNPGLAYTEAVKEALVDAMIENSGSLLIGQDEWLTVAARDNADRSQFVARDPSDVSTLVFRIKGSDILAFRSGRLTIEEARARVDVREF